LVGAISDNTKTRPESANHARLCEVPEGVILRVCCTGPLAGITWRDDCRLATGEKRAALVFALLSTPAVVSAAGDPLAASVIARPSLESIGGACAGIKPIGEHGKHPK
jgi:hypothetical protein